MARRVLKHVVMSPDGSQADAVPVPFGAEILHVGCQAGCVVIWAASDEVPARMSSPRKFRVFGTGHSIPSEYATHIGSCQDAERGLVWHVFEAA